MNDNASPTESGGATIKAEQSKCPLFPTGQASPAGMAFFTAPGETLAAVIAFESWGIAQTEARYRTSFSRTRQKRGPPSLLS